jgi:hypothetical protein
MKRMTALLATAVVFVPTAYAASGRVRARPLPQEPLPGGFHWHDALIGGAFVLGAVLLLVGLVVLKRGDRLSTGRAMLACVGAALFAALTLTATAVAAGPEYRNFTTLPFSETNVSCTGEEVEVSGVIRHHVVFVIDGTGGFHGNGIFTAIATGTSASGTRYVANFTSLLSQYIGPVEAPAAATSPFSFRLISNDGTPNLQVRGFFHITVDANGTVRVFTSELTVECT